MNKFELALLQAIRVCEAQLMRVKQGDPRGSGSRLNSECNAVLRALNGLQEAGGSVALDQALQQIQSSEKLNKDMLGQLINQLYRQYYDLTGVPHPDSIDSDDELRNVNSYEYLRQLAHLLPKPPSHALKNDEAVQQVIKLCGPGSKYNPDIPYGNLYTNFILALEKHIIHFQLMRDDPDVNRPDHVNSQFIAPLDKVIEALYTNPNFAIERAYHVVHEPMQGVRQTHSGAVAKTVRGNLRSSGSPVQRRRGANVTTPVQTGSKATQVQSLYSPDYHPMSKTSHSSVVRFAYQGPESPMQLRFGTQTQIQKGNAKVNPLFERWLEIRAAKAKRSRKKPFTHVYFNNLQRVGAAGKKVDIKRRNREKAMTKQLDEIEKTHPNTAVITLPASGGMLKHTQASKLKKDISYENAKKHILDIAMGRSDDKYAGDFYISRNVEALLFGDDKERILESFLTNSFAALGFEERDQLSEADKQAVYFHFLKFELTNFIIEKLEPDTFNFSCKDAIDRGGAASAYYNLIKSIKSGKPMSQREFETALHGAAVLVKGRGMNHQSEIVWNAIDAYLEANKANKSIPAWLPQWRNQHAIPPTRRYFLNALRDYKKMRQADPRQYKGLFAGPDYKSKQGKIDAVEQMINALAGRGLSRSANQMVIQVTADQFRSLHDKRLGVIIKGMEKAGHILIQTKPSDPEKQPLNPNGSEL